MKRVAVVLTSVLCAVGAAGGPASAAGTSAGADRVARAAAEASGGGSRSASAVCNPTRSTRTAQQLRNRWTCRVRVSATPAEIADFGQGTAPTDPRPFASAVRVAWADGEYEAGEVERYTWDPLPVTPDALGMVTARRLVWNALQDQGFPDQRAFVSSRLKCSRSTKIAVRCSVAWVVGDSVSSGRIRIASTGDLSTGQWTASWKIKTLDEFCRYVKKRSRARCTTTDVVR